MSDIWERGQRVHVFMDLGEGKSVMEDGVIVKVQDKGPFDHRPERRIQIQFDNELLMGGTGRGWVSDDQLTTSG